MGDAISFACLVGVWFMLLVLGVGTFVGGLVIAVTHRDIMALPLVFLGLAITLGAIGIAAAISADASKEEPPHAPK